MAENKKSFVAYCDWGEIFDNLSNEKAGKLIKHIFDYVRDKDPISDDETINLLFITIKQTLKRDLKKYENYVEKQKINGSKGGRPKGSVKTETQKTQAFSKKPKKADNVSVSVSVNDSEKDKDIKKKHKYGIYKNVLLTDNELEKLKNKFNGTFDEKLKNFSEGLEMKGYTYKSHYLAILKWNKDDNGTHKQSITGITKFTDDKLADGFKGLESI
jgi:hypothetical protein